MQFYDGTAAYCHACSCARPALSFFLSLVKLYRLHPHGGRCSSIPSIFISFVHSFFFAFDSIFDVWTIVCIFALIRLFPSFLFLLCIWNLYRSSVPISIGAFAWCEIINKRIGHWMNNEMWTKCVRGFILQKTYFAYRNNWIDKIEANEHNA